MRLIRFDIYIGTRNINNTKDIKNKGKMTDSRIFALVFHFHEDVLKNRTNF